MHEETAVLYLKERYALKERRMHEKLIKMNKSIKSFKNFIYDDPEDSKKQRDFLKIFNPVNKSNLM